MHKVRLTYELKLDGSPPAGSAVPANLHHPLMALLSAVHESGSISGAARQLGLSYRHTWGELKRWEIELGQPLVRWVKGQSALLSPFASKLLWAERLARARLAPQIEALRSELERAFAVAFDDSARVINVCASHDEALPRLRDGAREQQNLHLDIRFMGSVAALKALNEGRCLLAGFHALTQAPRNSPTARVYRPLLQPGQHKLIGFARRTQGLIVAAGNPLGLVSLRDLQAPGVRFVNRERGTGTRVVLEELLQAAGLTAADLPNFDRTEPSHQAAAEAVASGAADAAFGIEAAARAKGLGFIALAHEDYFLATLACHLDAAPVQALLQTLRSDAWQQALTEIPGYAPQRCGDIVALRQALPWWTYRQPKR